VQNYLKEKIEGFYDIKPELLSKKMQANFTDLEVQRGQSLIRFYVKENEGFTAEGLKVQLSRMHIILCILHYANAYKVSFVTYGHHRLSYTWLAPEYAVQLEVLAAMKLIDERREMTNSASKGISGSCTVLVFSGLPAVVEQIKKIIEYFQRHAKRIPDLPPPWEESDFILKGSMEVMDFSITMKAELQSRLDLACNVLFQGVASGSLFVEEMQQLKLVELSKRDPNTSGSDHKPWFNHGFLN